MTVRRARHVQAAALGALALLLLPPACAETMQEIIRPDRVPRFEFISMGDGVEPGSAAVYGFDLRNRYNSSIQNVTVTLEIYRWATPEQARPVGQVARPPWFESTGGLGRTLSFPVVGPNATVQVRESVRAAPETTEGVYFTRHTMEFDYANFSTGPLDPPEQRHFVMKSRGHFTQAQFESINYSDLEDSLALLNVSGIVPDSSLSVKSPVPLWPLAVIVAAAAVTGGLAYAGYLAEMHPDRYPRLKRQMLRWSGALRVRRAMLIEGLREKMGGRAK